MKRTKGLQRVLALSLACGLILTPAMQSNVYAEDQLPVTRYATPEQALTSFDTDSATTDKTAKKVIFGKDATGASLEWYIAGQGASCEISVADFPWRAEKTLQALVS